MHILPDKLNPCKQESGELGGYIYDFIVSVNDKIVKLLTPKIQCRCCRNVNYWFLKYGLVILFASIIPFIPIIGFLMVLAALAFRIIERINITQLRKKEFLNLKDISTINTVDSYSKNDMTYKSTNYEDLIDDNIIINDKKSKKSKKVSD